jgi:hypothetical protein
MQFLRTLGCSGSSLSRCAAPLTRIERTVQHLLFIFSSVLEVFFFNIGISSVYYLAIFRISCPDLRYQAKIERELPCIR